MGYAILPVSLALIDRLVRLPEGMEVISAHENHWDRTLDLTIKSDRLPEPVEGCELNRLPRLEIVVEQRWIDGEVWSKTSTKISWWDGSQFREEPISG